MYDSIKREAPFLMRIFIISTFPISMAGCNGV